jgi:hypothetical protein
MFRAIPCSSTGGHIVLLQHLVLSLSVSSRSVHRLRADCSPLSTSALNGCNTINNPMEWHSSKWRPIITKPRDRHQISHKVTSCGLVFWNGILDFAPQCTKRFGLGRGGSSIHPLCAMLNKESSRKSTANKASDSSHHPVPPKLSASMGENLTK